MADLVPITDPHTGRVYHVHPFVAEHGEWLPTDRAGLRAALPGIAAFERFLAHTQPDKPTPAAAPMWIEVSRVP